jgi:hypothetical protein
VENDWLGFVIPGRDSGCSCGCRRLLEASSLAVAGGRGGYYSFKCAVRLGWVPSDTEAWTMTLYSTASTVIQ